MTRRGKVYLEASAKVDSERRYTLEQAIEMACELSFAKFNETLDFNPVLKHPLVSLANNSKISLS